MYAIWQQLRLEIVSNIKWSCAEKLHRPEMRVISFISAIELRVIYDLSVDVQF